MTKKHIVMTAGSNCQFCGVAGVFDTSHETGTPGNRRCEECLKEWNIYSKMEMEADNEIRGIKRLLETASIWQRLKYLFTKQI